MAAKAFVVIGAGLVLVAGVVAQLVAEGADSHKSPTKTVLVEFRAPGNSMNATVS
jgi:hypothetical protein